MAITHLFTVQDGHNDGRISFLSGNGAPTGVDTLQVEAPVGSFYEDISTGTRHRKHTAGAGANAWGFERSVPLKVIDNITTSQVIDTVFVQDYDSVVWFLSVTDVTDNRRRISQLVVGHDAINGAEATDIAFQESFNLEFPLASVITGLAIDIALAGAGATQVMQLSVSATNPVTAKIRQVVV